MAKRGSDGGGGGGGVCLRLQIFGRGLDYHLQCGWGTGIYS